jgi:pyroglutamyl-peptidase
MKTVIVLFGFFLSSQAFASKIVLTAFEPFGGAKENNSASVIAKLATLLQAAGPAGEIEVKTCVLPVEYDRGAKVALECIGATKPDLVLSLGEGGCEIDFETRARNRDQTGSADNAGVLRNTGSKIITGAPKFIDFNAPMVPFFRDSKQIGKARLFRSKDAGGYVCNNTAYWLSHAFMGASSPTKFGFIHVPPVACGPSVADNDVVARTIFEGMKASMKNLF